MGEFMNGIDISGEQAQEVAAPVQETLEPTGTEPATTGENEQEPAAPASETAPEPDAEPAAPLTDEQRRQNAATRRQREEAQRMAQLEGERRAAQARIDAAYAQAYAGQINPYTGKPILTETDFKAYQEGHRRAAASQQLAKAGIDPTTIAALVENSPVVNDLKQKLGSMERVAQDARMAQGRQLLEQELRAITAIDPDVKTLEDLFARPEAADIMGKVEKQGLTLLEAYKLTYFDRLQGKRAGAARQAALNQAAGKGHLKPSGVGAASETISIGDIPAETLEMYRNMNPGVSDGEIIKHYARSLGNGR